MKKFYPKNYILKGEFIIISQRTIKDFHHVLIYTIEYLLVQENPECHVYLLITCLLKNEFLIVKI